MSRIGRMPIPVPAGVEISIGESNLVTVKGPKGALTQQLSPSMTIRQEGAELLPLLRPAQQARRLEPPFLPAQDGKQFLPGQALHQHVSI